MGKQQPTTQGAPCNALDDFEDYTTDLVEGRTVEELIATVRILPVLAVEDPEEFTAEWCARIGARLWEHIADRLGVGYEDFYRGTRDWCVLHPYLTEFEVIATYAEVKAAELGDQR